MSPFSPERLQWIEARLFCLARMANELNATGLKRAQYMVGEYQEAHALFRAALSGVHTERLQLIAERAVIDAYAKEL